MKYTIGKCNKCGAEFPTNDPQNRIGYFCHTILTIPAKDKEPERKVKCDGVVIRHNQ